jgi:two-component system chemotaxis response regulator CheB
MIGALIQKVKAAAMADVSRYAKPNNDRQPIPRLEPRRALDESTDQVIALGSSTGGTEALARIMPAFPPITPGIVIVQHMPAGFTTSLAERLDKVCAMEVREAKDNDRVRTGLALLAPGGNRQMVVRRSGGQYCVRLKEAEKVSGHCPSVDVLYQSIARDVGKNAVAVLMTGMGKDGAKGLLQIRQAGGRTFVQDQKTSVVWGMPGVGWKWGAAEAQVPLDDIPKRIIEAIE